MKRTKKRWVIGFCALGLGAVGLAGGKLFFSPASEGKATINGSIELCVSYNATIAYTATGTHNYTIDNLSGGTTTMTLGYQGVYRQSKTDTYFQMNKKAGYLRNDVAFPGKITSLTTTWSTTTGATKCYFATNAAATSSDSTVSVTGAISETFSAPKSGEYYFFNIDTSSGSGSSQLTSLVVHYESVSTEPSVNVTQGLSSTHHINDGIFQLDATSDNFSTNPTFTWVLAANDYVDLLSGSGEDATVVTSFVGASAYFKPKAVTSTPIAGTLTVTNGSQTVGPLDISLTIDQLSCSSVSWAGSPNTNYLVNTAVIKANAGTITATLSDGSTVSDFDRMNIQVKAPGATEYADVSEPYSFPNATGSYTLRLGYLGTYSTGKTFTVFNDSGTPAEALATLNSAYSSPKSGNSIIGAYHLSGVVSTKPTSATNTFKVADDYSGTNAGQIYYNSSSSTLDWGAFKYSDAIIGANIGVKGTLAYYNGFELMDSTIESLNSYSTLAYISGSLDKTAYTNGQAFDPTGAQFTVGYSGTGGTSHVVEWTAEDHTGLSHSQASAFSLTDPTIAEDKDVTFTYVENGIQKTAIVTVHVEPITHFLSIATSATIIENGSSTLAITTNGYTSAAIYTVVSDDSTIATGEVSGGNLHITGAAAGATTLHVTITEGTTTDTADVAVTIGAATLTLQSSAQISKTASSFAIDYTIANFDSDVLVGLTNALTAEQSNYCTIVVGDPDTNGKGTITVSPKGIAGSINVGISAIATNKTVEKTIALSFVSNYVEVTSTSGLILGQKYAFGNKSKSKVMGALSSDYGTAIDATFNGSEFSSATAGVVAFTLVPGSTSGSYAFYTDSGFISSSSAKSISFSASTVDNSASWTLSYSSGWALTNVGDTTLQLQYNISSPRFTTYTGSQTAIEIYTLGAMNTSAEEWAENFLLHLTCDSQGINSPSFEEGASWASISASPTNAAGAQILKKYDSTKYNIASGSNIGDALAKYDYILNKYGTDSYTDALGRNPSNGNGQAAIINLEGRHTPSIIAISLIALATASVGWLFIAHKKKHN